MNIGINTDFNFGYLMDFISEFIIFIIPIVVIQLTLALAAVISIARKKKAPIGDKVLWILISLLINIIGPIIYFAVGSSAMDERIARMENEKEEWEARN